MKSQYSDEIINAFVDGELGGPEKENLKLQMETDDELYQRVKAVCELKKGLKESYSQVGVRKNYEDEPDATISPFRYGMAALLVMGLGVLIGWYSHGQLSHGQLTVTQNTTLQGVRLSPVNMDQPNKVVLHISSADKDKLQQTLMHVEKIIDKYQANHLPFEIEIIANAGGVDLLRVDATPYEQKIAAIMDQYKNVSFIACSNALERLKLQGIEPRLISHAKTGVTAIEQIVKRLQEGWVYVKV